MYSSILRDDKLNFLFFFSSILLYDPVFRDARLSDGVQKICLKSRGTHI